MCIALALREKNDDIHYFFLMMHNCSYKFNNYIRLCLERIERNQTGSSDWLESTSTAVKIWHIKVIPQKKKSYLTIFKIFFFKCSLPMAVPKNIKRRAGHRACLREMTDQTHPIYASTSNFSRASFQGIFFGSWKQKFSK